MDEKYTDEQIVVALMLMSHLNVCREAYGLINRQKAEIERLKEHEHILEKKLSECWERIAELDKLNETARAEAVKKFAERANEKLSYYLEQCGDFAPFGMADIIVNIVKEMTEDEGK